MSNVLNESAENYLETILILSQKLPVVRSVDIANELGFKKSSVSVAMKNLREKEHIKVDEQGFIHLTPSGLEIANMIYERHTLLSVKKVSKRSRDMYTRTKKCKSSVSFYFLFIL